MGCWGWNPGHLCARHLLLYFSYTSSKYLSLKMELKLHVPVMEDYLWQTVNFKRPLPKSSLDEIPFL